MKSIYWVKKSKDKNNCFSSLKQASFSLNVSLLLRKPVSNSGQNPILRSENSNAAAIAADSANPPDLSDELNLSHDGNGGRNSAMSESVLIRLWLRALKFGYERELFLFGYKLELFVCLWARAFQFGCVRESSLIRLLERVLIRLWARAFSWWHFQRPLN